MPGRLRIGTELSAEGNWLLFLLAQGFGFLPFVFRELFFGPLVIFVPGKHSRVSPRIPPRITRTMARFSARNAKSFAHLPNRGGDSLRLQQQVAYAFDQ